MKRDIVRPGEIRFTSSFLELQRLMEKKKKKRKCEANVLFRSMGQSFKWSKNAKETTIAAIVLKSYFLEGCELVSASLCSISESLATY